MEAAHGTGALRMNAAAPIYLYGAGNMGREVLAHLRGIGMSAEAFIDRAAGRIDAVDGIPVLPVETVGELGADGEIVVALHSPGVDVASVVATLRRDTAAKVITLWTACERQHWLPRAGYWLAPHWDWTRHGADIAAARALFDDETSRRVFDQQLALRRGGDYDGLDRPSSTDQYAPSDLPRWHEPISLVDCGAFDGDTIRFFDERFAIESVVALEPDPDNFERLRAGFGGDARVRLLNCGAHSSTGRLAFAAGVGGAAHLDDDGSVEIDVVCIDDVCADHVPTLIKMDIEGAERDALVGAAATLSRCRPALAVSAYHRVDDLWRLPLLVDTLVSDYTFHLRSHAFNGFDTVLYAVPAT